MSKQHRIKATPLTISEKATILDLNAAMVERRNMINAQQVVMASTLGGQALSRDVLLRVGEAAELLNDEVDALEKLTLLH